MLVPGPGLNPPPLAIEARDCCPSCGNFHCPQSLDRRLDCNAPPEVELARRLEAVKAVRDEYKGYLDAIAEALNCWPGGTRNAYRPDLLPAEVTKLRDRCNAAEDALDDDEGLDDWDESWGEDDAA